MKPEQGNKKVPYIILGIVLYIIMVLICFHIGYQEGTSMKTADKNTMYYIQAGMESFETDPFGFFPIQPESWIYIGVMTVIYIFAVLIIWANWSINRHDRAGEEYGSSKWYKNYAKFRKNFTDPVGKKETNGKKNIVLAEDLFMSYDGRATQLNIHEVVIGGSGTGKTRFKVKPNALQANTSYVITDPSGELLESLGKTMEMQGYDIKVLNLVNMEMSHNYNPFDYVERKDQFKKENDVTKMVDTIMANTVDPNAAKGEAFWEDSMRALYAAVIHLLLDFGRPEEQNFATVLKYIRQGKIEEGQNGQKPELEKKFENAKIKEEEEIKAGVRIVRSKAFTNWEIFKLAGFKTAQSILISAAVRIGKFDNDSVAQLTSTNYENPENNIRFDTVGDRPTAMFCITPTADLSFNFIVAELYSQMFDVLYYKAENIYPKTYSIRDNDGFSIQSLIPSQKKAEERLEELKKVQIRTRNKRERFNDSDKYEIVEKKNKKQIKKQKSEMHCAGRVMYQVYIPFFDKTKEEVLAMSYKERKEYLKLKNAGGEVIREFYCEKLAKEYIEAIQSAHIERGRKELAWPVRFLLDEFANITALPLFSERLATMRKFLISCMIILQNLEQLKKNYEKSYSSIKGNCDITTFLGSSEIETTKEVAELLGDATNRTQNTSVNAQKTGKSFNQTGRKLMDPSELTRMDNRFCIVRLRGMLPFFRKKYDYENHPNYFLTGDAYRNNQFDEEYQNIFFKRQGNNFTKEEQKISMELPPMTKEEQEKAITDIDMHKDVDDFLFHEGYASVEEFLSHIEMQDPLHEEVEDIDGVVIRKRNEMIDAAQIDELIGLMNQSYTESEKKEESFYTRT